MQNILKELNSFLSALRTTYNQQGRTAKILFPAVFLLAFCCLCSVAFSLIPRGGQNSPGITPSPFVIPTQGTQITPTALFSFGTPFPTLSVPTPLPTTPSPATATQPPTPTVPTATDISTATSIPSATQPPITPTSGNAMVILAVDKPAEYVDIQNVGNGPVDLSGWSLVSETGNQSCALEGILQASEIMRVWARRGSPGFSCRFPINIWNDNQADPAVLYNPQGQAVSQYP